MTDKQSTVVVSRERFQKWVLSTEHPVYGWLDGHWLKRGDDREGYANEYVQGLWVAFKAFSSRPTEQAVDVGKRHHDTFNGDNKKLASCITALLKLDASGALVPHGIGGHARALLEASAARLMTQYQAEPFEHQSEPVAWVNPSNLARFKGDIGATVYQCSDSQVPLYRHAQPPAKIVLPERIQQVLNFLDGQGELDGCVYGEQPEGRNKYWWRKELRDAVTALNTPQD
jgi:hypothetical protein